MKKGKFNITVNIPPKIFAIIWLLIAVALAYMAYGFKGAFWVTLVIGLLTIGNLKN